MKIYLSCLLVSCALSWNFAQASIQVKDGVVTIDVSGSDAQSYSESGTDAGKVNLVLSYADAAKTIVSVGGSTSHYGKTSPIAEKIALKDLKNIRIYAVGGNGANGDNGYNGSQGSAGSNGSDGYNGSDGCPPSNGNSGGDGGRGGDGGNGTAGGNGGNGGNGGIIHIATSPDQNELMLYVSVNASSGAGGDGGAGGSGGSGGPGGIGGQGGAGGRNTCVDDKGQPTNGFDGSRGWSGNNGSSGNSGYNGSNGSAGSGGRAGSYSFDLVSKAGTQNFKSRFDLKITGAKFADDNDDSVLEPGERVYLVSLEVTNKSSMPSPEGQPIQFSFASTSTLISPTSLNATLSAIAPGGHQTLNFKKGALPLQVPDQAGLIGKKALAKGFLSINNVHLDYDVDSGMSIHWPVSSSANNAKISALFEVPQKDLVYTLKNVGSRDLGDGGNQPLYVEFAWTSSSVSGSEVVLVLADGRTFSLDQAVQLSDVKIPANASVALPVNLLFHDSKNLSKASGTLTMSLRLQDFNSGHQDVLQSISINVNLNLDVNALIWNQTLNLAKMKIQCIFPYLTVPEQPLASVQISKVQSSNQLQVQVEVPGSASSSTSPLIHLQASPAFSYLEQFRGTWTSQTAVDFLNKLVSPASPKGPWSFKSCKAVP